MTRFDKWSDLSVLRLLDDGDTLVRGPRTRETDLLAWQEMTRIQCRKILIGPKQTNKALATLTTRPQQPRPKFFSSRPTFGQMLKEYNRTSIRPSPILNNATGEFSFQRIDFIQIPSIPGRVLRPSRSRRSTNA